MALKSVAQGSRFEVCAWTGEDGGCSLKEFFKKLKEEAHPDLVQAARLLEHSAENGPPRNIEQSRKLKGKGAKGLFEFKAGAVRIIYFFDRKRLICTHGFMKIDDPSREIAKGKEIKIKYEAEQQRNRDREEQLLRKPVRRVGRKR